MQPFAGEIKLFAGTFAPEGWFFCNGVSLNTSQYSELFAVIGYTYGGSGSSFNLPDLRAYAPMGQGQGAGLTNRTVGVPVGTLGETLTGTTIPPHTHSVQATAQVADNANPTTRYFARTSAANMYSTLNDKPVLMAPSALGAMGGNHAHENRQPRLGINFIIAYYGDYPVRP